MEPLTFTGSVQLCFSVEQHVCTLFSLELLLYVSLPDGGHCGVIQVKPVATLLSDRKRGREKQRRKVINISSKVIAYKQNYTAHLCFPLMFLWDFLIMWLLV